MSSIRTGMIQSLCLAALAANLGACGKNDAAAAIKEAGLAAGPTCPSDAGVYDDAKIQKAFIKMAADSGMKKDYIPGVLQLHSSPGKKGDHTCISWVSIVIKGSKGMKFRLAPDGVKGLDAVTQKLLSKGDGVEELHISSLMSLGDAYPMFYQVTGPATGGSVKVTGKYLEGQDETSFKLDIGYAAGTATKDILNDGSENQVRAGFGGGTAAASGSGSASSSGSGTASASGSGSASSSGTSSDAGSGSGTASDAGSN